MANLSAFSYFELSASEKYFSSKHLSTISSKQQKMDNEYFFL